MARELNIRITADADNAKRELTQVEQILEKNTQAAERSQKTIGGESGNGGLVGVIGKLGGIMAGLGFRCRQLYCWSNSAIWISGPRLGGRTPNSIARDWQICRVFASRWTSPTSERSITRSSFRLSGAMH